MTHSTKHHQGPAGLKAIVSEISEQTGYTVAQLCGRARFPGMVEARHRLWIACIDEGYTSGQIGRALGCDDSNVRLVYRKHLEQERIGLHIAGLATPARKEEPNGQAVTRTQDPTLRGDTTPPRRRVSLASGSAQTGSPNLVV